MPGIYFLLNIDLNKPINFRSLSEFYFRYTVVVIQGRKSLAFNVNSVL